MRKSVLLVISITAFFSSCSTYTYIKNAPNIPMLESSGETQINTFVGTNHIEFQGAFALTDNLGIMANSFFSYDDQNQYYELGMGINSLKLKNLEVFGGFGYGEINELGNYNHDFPIEGTMAYKSIFIQPTWIFKSKSVFKPAITFKTDFVNYSNYNYTNIGDFAIVNGEDIKMKNISGFVLHPVFTLKTNKSWINVIGQIGYSFPIGFQFENFMNKDLRNTHPIYQGLTLNLGLNLKFDFKQ